MLIFIHLFANYNAVRSLNFDIVNLQRYQILIKNFLEKKEILSVPQGNFLEPILPDLFSNLPPVRLHLGCSLQAAVSGMSSGMNSGISGMNQGISGINGENSAKITDVLKLFGKKNFLICLSFTKLGPEIFIILKSNADVRDMLESVFIAFLLLDNMHNSITICDRKSYDRKSYDQMAPLNPTAPINLLSAAANLSNEIFDHFLAQMESKHWNISHCVLGFDDWRLYGQW